MMRATEAEATGGTEVVAKFQRLTAAVTVAAGKALIELEQPEETLN